MLHRSRLVTLTGPAGVGKTRTAIELGRSQARQRADGVWFVDLASVSRTEDVAAEAAWVLDIRGAARDATTDAVRRYLADRDVLLMLDNCEHVLDACAELGMTLLGACPHLRILATSREPLGITGEAVWRLVSIPSSRPRFGAWPCSSGDSMPMRRRPSHVARRAGPVGG